MSKVNLITQAAYAKHRGVSEAAVSKAIKAGRISLIDGMLDASAADMQWARNSRVRAGSRLPPPAGALSGPLTSAGDNLEAKPARRRFTDVCNSVMLAQAALAVRVVEAAGATDERTGDSPECQKSRARQAAADARTAEIRLAELEGSLIRVDQVKAVLASMLAPVREGLLQIPARLAPLLAPQSGPARIQTLLEIEIHQVLAAPRAPDRCTAGRFGRA